MKTIINHFDKFPLKTKKRADFILFKSVVELMIRKEHLTEEGFRKILAIKVSMNQGLSPELKSAFPDVIPAERPLILDPKITNPHWLAGFTSGEGYFLIKITKSPTLIGWRVQLVFQITQHVRDEQLIKSLIAYLDCGTIYKTSTTPNEINFIVTKFSEIIGKIIPFFQSNRPINGVKALDFLDWCRVAKMMKEKKHLTKEGLEQIKKNKSRNEYWKKVLDFALPQYLGR